MKCIKTEDAVGHVLCHDMTQIIPGVSKGPRFCKGHIVTAEDIPVLLSMGKEQLYVWELQPGFLHENDAAERLCALCQNANMRKSETKEGKIVHSRYDKFRQMNRFLEFIEDIVPELPKDRESVIIDFGCGKSYLTFAMYYYLKELKKYDVHIIGLDLKEDVIRKCNGLAEKYGYEKLHFLCGDIAEYEGVQKVDMVVTLHACDKATDYALAKAVEWDAQVILSVPCCQHELNDQIQNKLLSPVLKYGLLKERMSALLTDGIRAELLESKGYSTQILEFIDMEHTPKNLLIRAVKTGRSRSGEALKEMTDAIHGHLTLEKLLYPDGFGAKEGV